MTLAPRPRLVVLLFALAAFAEEPRRDAGMSYRERLAHPRNTVRLKAAKEPPELFSVEDLAALTAALRDVDVSVQMAAAEGLQSRAAAAGKTGARALAAVVADPRSGAQEAAARALTKFGETAWTALRPSLLEKDVYVAVRPWEVMLRADDRFTLDLLRNALLHDTEPAIRAGAASVLRRLKIALPAILDDIWKVVIEDAPAQVRAAAIGAFGRLARIAEDGRLGHAGEGGRDDRILKAIPVIHEMASDPDPGVRAAVKDALAAMERKRVPR
ncbi:MAG: hypothetical protein K8T20_13210 [Planctomycetes bacterium]|nr:hypothetical protein [Planctomycetota bacterium]